MFSKFAAKLLLKSQAIQAGRGWHHRLRVSFVTVLGKLSTYKCLPHIPQTHLCFPHSWMKAERTRLVEEKRCREVSGLAHNYAQKWGMEFPFPCLIVCTSCLTSHNLSRLFASFSVCFPFSPDMRKKKKENKENKIATSWFHLSGFLKGICYLNKNLQ